MVVQNYPRNFVGDVRSKYVADVVSFDSSTGAIETKATPTTTTRTESTSEYKELQKQINKLEKASRTKASPKTLEMIDKRLQQLYEAQRNLEREGRAYYTVEQVPEQTARDVVITPSGFQSKAYDLQTPEEKKRTAELSSNLKSTSEGIVYKGDNNGSVLIGSNNRVNPYDDVARVDSAKGVSQNVSQVPQSTVKRTEEVFGKPTLYGRILIGQSEAQELARTNSDNPFKYNVRGYVYGAVSVPVLIFTQPKEFARGIWTSLTNPVASAQAIGQELRTQPEFFIGQQIGTYGTFKGVGAVGGVIKNTYVKTGSTYIPSEQVFSSQVLTEGKTFPMSKSSSYALEQFNKQPYVQTSAPSKLSGTTAGEGNFGNLGLEDSGIYVTPKGEGSPYFLEVGRKGEYSLTLNPFKPIIDFFKTPTVTEFKVKGISQIPREVVSQPGFEPVKTFFKEEGSKTGQAYITKRSEIGQRELPRQTFRTPLDKIDKLFGETRRVTESGTGELEAVVPFGTKFEYTPKTKLGKVKGFEEYTTYEGANVPIRRAELLSEQDLTTAPKFSSTRGTVGEASLESSRAMSSSKSYSPTSSLKYYYGSSNYSNVSSPSYDLPEISSTSNTSSNKSYEVYEFSEPISQKIDYVPPSYTPPSSPPSYTPPSSPPSYTPPSSPPSYTPPSSPPSYTPPKVPEHIPPPETYDFNKISTGSKKKAPKSKLFVRKKGKFELKGESEDLGSLFKRGRDIIENTASASFKVVSESGTAILPNIVPSKFTQSKREKGVLVQKRQFRISTAGEKFEIPGKAQQVNRARRLL
jgi:hypothetical protein